jgi:hypothetical protein
LSNGRDRKQQRAETEKQMAEVWSRAAHAFVAAVSAAYKRYRPLPKWGINWMQDVWATLL